MRADTEHEQPSATRDRIKAIAADVFQTDTTHVDLAMGPEDIERWDSLNHLRLITEIEGAFSIHLTMQQIQEIESLEDVARFVSQDSQ